MKKLILASQSPFRKELLKRLQIPFETSNPRVNEDIFKSEIKEPLQLAQTLAKQKAVNILAGLKDTVVIGSDQVAHCEGEILDKPGSKEKALEQLISLNGKTHELITSVYIVSSNKAVEFTNITRLTMKNLSPAELSIYIDKDQPFQSAGSYMIERAGIALFSKIDTDDFTAIIGLPLLQLTQALQEFEIKVLS